MRQLLRRSFRFFALGCAIILPGLPAHAEERLVMPYTCSTAGGRVMLRPSYEESYRIFETRAQRLFNACSPVNPGLCRTWMLHAFEIDCGGTRVSWPAIVAAGAELNNRRAWLLDNGRLQVGMGQWWGARAGYPPCGPRRWRGRFDPECDRETDRAPPVVEMPPGFAPMLGLGGRFITIEAPAAGAAAAPPLPTLIRPAPKADRPEPPREAASTKEAAVKDTRAKEVPAKEIAVTKEPVAQAPASVPKSPGTPAAPRIINAPGATPLPVERASPIERAPATVVAKNVPALAPPAPAPARETAQGPAIPSVPPAAPAKEAVSGPHTIVERSAPVPAREIGPAPSVMSARAPSTAQAIGIVAVLIVAVFSVFAWTRWRDRARLAAATGRDVAARDLEGDAVRIAAPRPALAPPGLSGDGVRAHPPAPPPFPSSGDDVPRNRTEAIALLGANTDAGIEALKKIVDGLRQSWHPDHATSEADRSLREHRIKQINAAWDLIIGRRAPA